MTPERWEQVGRIYEAVSAVAPENRAGFLREACGEDQALRDEVESLLASGSDAGEFLIAGAMADAAKALAKDSVNGLAGGSLGHYRIASLLGSGGMGEVYRARDTRLSRDVAVKVLSPEALTSGEARRRFDQEARAVAALSHPNIRSLYDVGEAYGRIYAVMELLEGETLRARLSRGPLRPPKAAEIGAAIAEGLAAAHAEGIVHRDVKPENVFITTGGIVKILDFGVAKMLKPTVREISEDGAELRTAPGLLLGTVGYMSPEEVSGAEADARADIFALGCVLYEMATGKRAFQHRTAADTMAAILREDPELEVLDDHFRRAIERCLEKQPKARFQSAQDLAFHLRAFCTDAAVGSSRTRSGDRPRVHAPWPVAGAVIALCLASVVWFGRPQPSPATYSYLLPPENAAFCLECGIAISPDGQRLAYVARSAADLKDSLWVQRLSEPSPQRMPGTEGARHPFWSPDSRSMAYFSGDTLYRIDVAEGVPQRVCRPCNGQAGAWSPDGVIVFCSVGNALRGVASSGGDPYPLTEMEAGSAGAGHLFPAFLPGGRRFLFVNASVREPAARGLYMASLESKVPAAAPVFTGTAAPRSSIQVAGRYVLFVQEGALVAAELDGDPPRLNGRPIPIGQAAGAFSISDTGAVFFPRTVYELAWLDRSGRELGSLPIRGDFHALQLSHDGRRVAVTRSPLQSGANDVWVYELDRGVGAPLTTNPARDALPLWSPDDEWIAFGSDRNGRWSVYRKRSTGMGAEQLVFGPDVGVRATSWSRDGRSLILSDSGDANDLWRLLLPDGKATLLFETPFKEWAGETSPDGRWLAYNSDETGEAEVFVQAFPPNGSRWRISSAGGLTPKWRADGRELFFVDPNSQKVMAVDVRQGPGFQAGRPRVLFDAAMIRNSAAFPDVRSRGYRFDVSADGRRFLIVRAAKDGSSQPITLVQNWMAVLKR